jgi:hypothetical protein
MFAARQLLLQHTDFIRLSFITSAIYAFACALSGVMWWEWVVTGGGNANFVFGVRSVRFAPFFFIVCVLKPFALFSCAISMANS